MEKHDSHWSIFWLSFYMQMNEFKSPAGFSSAPLANGGEVREEDPVNWVSQGNHILVFQTEGSREFLYIIILINIEY